MASASFHFLLLFVLLKFTRGYNGIPVVCVYSLENFTVFATDFETFCKGLIKHCAEVTKKKGVSYLAHREGFHMAYSGMNFIKTLVRSRVRQRLVSFAEKWEHVISQLELSHAQTLSAADIIAMGDSLPQYVAVAIQKGNVRMAAKYLSMDCMRVLMHVLEYVCKCKPVVYDDMLHSWFLARQSKKYRRETQRMLAYFGALSCDLLNKAIHRMRKALNATTNVNASTMFVLFCETRRAINNYSLCSVRYLIEQYDSSAKLRDVVSTARYELSDGVSTECHTNQLLEAIRMHLGLSLNALRKLHPKRICTVSELAFQLGRRRICPKVELDGIPEFHVLARALSVVYVKVHDASSIRELRMAASVMGVKYCKSLSKQTLGRRVRARMGQPVGTGKRKRCHAELVDAVTAAGGVVRWYESVRGRRVRCRMSKPSMEAFLRES